MINIVLVLGIISTITGIIFIALSAIFLRENRIDGILFGIVFLIFGILFTWGGIIQSDKLTINTRSSKDYTGVILLILVPSLFILKGALDIRDGFKNLKNKSISPSSRFKEKFKIIVGFFVPLVIIFFMALFLLSR